MKQTGFILPGRLRPLGWTLAALSVAVIFIFSGQTGEESGALSTQIAQFLARAFTGTEMDPGRTEFSTLHLLVRKAAHAAVYCMLALSVAFLLHTYPLTPRIRYLGAAGFCLACAAADEFQQHFRAGRTGAVTDVLIDMGGALAGLIVFYCLLRLIRRPRSARMQGTPGDAL